MLAGLGAQELLVIFLIIAVLFGAKRLPQMGRSLGEGIKEFRKVGKAITDDIDAEEGR